MQCGKETTLDRETAVEIHNQLRVTQPSIIAMGKFYRSILDQRLWPSQRAMAIEMDVSFPQVSRMVAAARLPEALLNIFENRTVTFRNIDILQTLTRQLGEVEIVRRARFVAHDCSLEDVFSILTTGQPIGQKGVRISVIPGKRYLRLDVPNFDRIAPRIVELEQILNVLLKTAGQKNWVGTNAATQGITQKKPPTRHR